MTAPPIALPDAPSGRQPDSEPGSEPGSRRGWVPVAALLVGVAVLLAVLTPGPGDQPLDPDSAGPSGSRAVAQILRAHGVPVTKVTTSTEALRLTAAARSTTLVVVRTGLLGAEQLARLKTSPARLVLVEPDQGVIDGLALRVGTAGTEKARVASPGCPAAGPSAAGDVLAGGRLYGVTDGGTTRGVDLCYPGRGVDGWSYVDGDLGGSRATLIGQGDLLTNEHLADEGNAALALATLGREARVVWYVPDPFESGTAARPTSLTDLAPPWVRFLLVQLAVTALLLMVWRGRRLGPLVTEPLPVVVRSTETLEGRAALYRQAGARDRAAATLRTATLRRLAGRLDLARDTPPEVAVGLVAAAAGRPPDQTRALLLGPPPRSDSALVSLVRDLDALEADLRTKDRRS